MEGGGRTDGGWRRVPPFPLLLFLFPPPPLLRPRRTRRGGTSGEIRRGLTFFPPTLLFPNARKCLLFLLSPRPTTPPFSFFFARRRGTHSLIHFPLSSAKRKTAIQTSFPSRLPPPPRPALAKAKARLKASLGCTHRHFPPPLIDFFRATTNSGLKPPPPPLFLLQPFLLWQQRRPSLPFHHYRFYCKGSFSFSLYLSQPSFTSCSSFSLPTTTTLRINKTRRWSGGAARSSSSSSSSTLASLSPPAPLPQVTSMQVEGGREGCAFVLLLLLLRQRERGKKGGDTPFFQPPLFAQSRLLPSSVRMIYTRGGVHSLFYGGGG